MQQVPTGWAGMSVRTERTALPDWVSTHTLLSLILPLILTTHMRSAQAACFCIMQDRVGRVTVCPAPKRTCENSKVGTHLILQVHFRSFLPMRLWVWKAETEYHSQLPPMSSLSVFPGEECRVARVQYLPLTKHCARRCICLSLLNPLPTMGVHHLHFTGDETESERDEIMAALP